MSVATRIEPGTRERLLDAAEAVLAERGPTSVSLREIARRAGVSHGAPKRHFPSLANLLAHVAARGFWALHAAVAAAVEAERDVRPAARLVAAGRGYVGFALDHPGAFALMWRQDQYDCDDTIVQEAGVAAFIQLVQLVEAVQAEGWLTGESPARAAAVLWAQVHGIAALRDQAPVSAEGGAEALVELSCRALLGADL